MATSEQQIIHVVLRRERERERERASERERESRVLLRKKVGLGWHAGTRIAATVTSLARGTGRTGAMSKHSERK